MAMPEAAVDEDYLSASGENEVRLSGETGGVELKPVSA